MCPCGHATLWVRAGRLRCPAFLPLAGERAGAALAAGGAGLGNSPAGVLAVGPSPSVCVSSRGCVRVLSSLSICKVLG